MKYLLDNQQLPRGPYPLISSATKPITFYQNYNFESQKITISTRGNPGFVMWQPQRFWATALAAVLSVKDQSVVNPKFLYYALKLQERELQMKKEGGGVKALYFNHFKTLMIDLPDLAIQNAIVTILDDLEQIACDFKTGLPARIKQANLEYQYYLKQLF